MTYNTSTLMTLCSPDGRSPRIAGNQLAAGLLNGEDSPPQLFRTEKQLTAPADRPERAAAGAFGVSTAVAVRSVWRRLSPRSFTGHRNRPGSPLATPPPGAPPRRGREAGGPSHHSFARPARPYSASIAEIYREWRCKMILKEPHARAA